MAWVAADVGCVADSFRADAILESSGPLVMFSSSRPVPDLTTPLSLLAGWCAAIRPGIWVDFFSSFLQATARSVRYGEGVRHQPATACSPAADRRALPANSSATPPRASPGRGGPGGARGPPGGTPGPPR